MQCQMAESKIVSIWWHPICGNYSPYYAFWNSELTINTYRPLLTICFQDTVLTWLPVFFLTVAAGYVIPSLRRKKLIHSSCSNVSVLCNVKTILCIFMALLSLACFMDAGILRFSKGDLQITNAALLAHPISAAAQILAAAITQMTFRRGLHTSATLFFYWSISLLCGILSFVSQVTYINSQDLAAFPHMFQFCAMCANFGFICILFVANCFADTSAFGTSLSKTDDEKTALLSGDTKKQQNSKKTNPQETASFLSYATFWWFNRIVVKGFRAPLKYSDMWDLNADNSTEVIVPTFEKEWKKSLMQYDTSKKIGSTKVKQPSFMMTIIRTYGSFYMKGFFMMLIQSILIVVNPFILDSFIQFIQDKENPYSWHGYLLAFSMFGCTALSVVFLHNAFYIGYITGMRLRTVVITNVYRKMLRLSCTARRDCSAGTVVNLMSVDAQKIQECFNWTHYLLTSPVEILVACFLLWRKIGVASLVGILFLIIVVPLNSILFGNMIRSAQLAQLRLKDERLKLMNQVLSGVKVLKLYAWEPYFQERILSIRNKEVKLLRRIAILSTINSVIIYSAGSLVAVMCFITYVSISDENILTPDVTFVSLSVINMMNTPAFMVPVCVMTVAQGIVSMKRVQKFLLLPEVDPECVTHDYLPNNAIRMENVTFSWGDRPILKNFSLDVKVGELVAVVGRVGAGKSSLISCLLGEMDKLAGSINVQGSIAYVPQQAWIQNMSVRNNILFSRPFIKRKYDDVLEACDLNADLKMLPAGDLTEIGERGINLSGGQKQRVSLARAVYQEEEVYLFDDPLSAVDAHVGKHLFDKVIGPEGGLKDKTRILATNSVSMLPHVDRILVLVDGCLVDSGTYEELRAREGAFVDFLKNHLQNETEDDLTESQDDMKHELAQRLSSYQSTDGSLSDIELSWNGHSEKSRINETEASVFGARNAGILVQEEVAEEGTVKLSVIKMYIMSASLIYLGVATIGFLLAIGGQVGNNVWLSLWSNQVTTSSNATNMGTMQRIGTYGGLAAVQVVGQFILSLAVCLGVVAAANSLHRDLLGNILGCPMSFFETTPLGRILNRFSKDVDSLDSDLRNYIQNWLMNVTILFSVLTIISYSTPMFLVAAVPIALAFVCLQRVYVATARQLKRIDSIRRSPIFANFSETINGVSSIVAYRQKKRFISHADVLLDDSQKIWYTVFTSNRWIGIISEFLSSMIILFAAMFCVIQQESLDPGTAGLSLSFALQVNLQIVLIVRYSCEMETYIVAVERIKEYCDTPKEAPWKIEGKSPSPSWPSKGEIVIQDYCTKYRPGLPLVLKGLTCNISAGEKVGIVGRTGAGKSSLTLSLFRIIEAAGGAIYIDGEDISAMGLHDLRSQLTIIPQDPVLFSGSLRFNVDPSQQYTDDKVLDALKHSHLMSFITSHPQGLEYECGEDGKNLSVGQRQLVCLTRALLRKTKVLVLDEATAAVDMATDDLIQTTIRTEFSHCTIVTIAHRLQTILDYDRVIVMHKGKLKEFDTPNSLLSKPSSIFYGMARDAGLV